MSKRRIEIKDLYKMVFVGDPQIHPNGELISFTKKTITEKHKYETQICTVSVKTKEVKQWTQGDSGNGGARWSPDGSQLAFTSGRGKPLSQIYLMPTDGGEARKLTNLPEGSIGGYKWSPNGKHIAFTFRETAEQFTTEAKKKREEHGGSTPPLEIDTEWYREDGDGYFGNQRFQLHLVNVASGKHHVLYKKAVLGDIAFSWAPNSEELIVTHSHEKHPLRTFANDQLYKVDLKGKSSVVPDLPRGGKSEGRYSPDGKHLAFLGDTDYKDSWGTRNTRLFTVSSKGGEPTQLTSGDDLDLSSSSIGDTKEPGGEITLFWNPTGTHIFTTRSKHGEEQLVSTDLKGKSTIVTSGDHVLVFGNLSADGTKLPAVHHTLTTLGEIAWVDTKTGHVTLLTEFNKELLGELDVHKPEAVWVESTDGVKVQAWCIKPSGFKAGHKYPAILEIHGGPHAQYAKTYFHEFQVLAAQGYVVVFSNPRGSKGYGEAFCHAISRNWGDKDWADIQTVRDWIKKQPFVDSSRLGVMGGSYGGYMTNWVIGHCHDFKAAITDRCVSNLVSMSGSSDYPLNPNEYFGGIPYGDIDDIRKPWRQSPVAYFKGVTAATLVIHSEGDLRCNIEQSEQIFYALKMQDVPSRFVRYPAETSHGMSRNGPPDLRLHRLHEIVKWWAKYL